MSSIVLLGKIQIFTNLCPYCNYFLKVCVCLFIFLGEKKISFSFMICYYIQHIFPLFSQQIISFSHQIRIIYHTPLF